MSTSSNTLSPAPKPVKSEDRASVPLENLFDDLEESSYTSEVHDSTKKTTINLKRAGQWDAENAASKNSRSSSTRSSPKPALNKVPSPLSKAFANSKPMADKPEIQKCNHCKRSVSKHAMPKHVEGCLNKKQEKQRKKKEAKDARDAAARKEKNGGNDDEDEGEEDAQGKKTTNKNSSGLSASKKRKAGDDDGDEGKGPAKKKKKGDNKAKPARPKAPVDVEKQCGVELPQGGQCARSLTCKSHSMGAKRAVPGRSAPYDKLLMEYQRKNQAKLQKAQFDAAKPVEEDEVPTGPVDSEDEKDNVMGAIGRSFGGIPIWNPTPVPLRSKYQHNRIKGMLQSAFGKNSGGGLFSGGGIFGGGSTVAAGPNVDDNGIAHARRGSVVPGARSMMPSSRKASVASAVGA